MYNPTWGVNLPPIYKPTRFVFAVVMCGKGNAEVNGRLYAAKVFRDYVENNTSTIPTTKEVMRFIDEIRAFHRDEPHGTMMISLPISISIGCSRATLKSDAMAVVFGILGCLGIMVTVRYVGEN